MVASLIALTHLKKLINRKKLCRWMHAISKIAPKVGWFLSPSFGDHECTFACTSLSFIWKYNENRFMNKKTINNSKIDNNNWCTVSYGVLIIGVFSLWGSNKWYSFWWLISHKIFVVVIIYIIYLLCGNYVIYCAFYKIF